MGEFFDKLRSKVPFSDRVQYIKSLAGLENFNMHWKMNELKRCKAAWQGSSAALVDAYKELGSQLLQLHTDDFVYNDRLSGYQLKEISDLSEIPIVTLVLELIKLLAARDSSVSASVWLALASFICQEADAGVGQFALKRLLNSDAAKLSSNVIDGVWKEELYPANDMATVASGLIWRMLGSPHAADRWRAAHSVRCLARFERWNVIDALVAKFETKDAGPFQAPELRFYFMHARLWLLIALARITLDDPKSIARYQEMLVQIVLDENQPHVLMRHFASQAILASVESGDLQLPVSMEELVKNIALSPFPRMRQKLKQGQGFPHTRPETAPEPKSKFFLDLDFEKYDVYRLSDVFGKPAWEVHDMMTEVVHGFDPDITSMYETGGRANRTRFGGMTSSHHAYGQQLGWHALFIVAGQLLKSYPVTDDWHYDDPWSEWLNRYLLTRKDGLWLSDGMDRMPLETAVNLLEKSKNGLVVTGNKSKVLQLVGLNSGVAKEIVVEGSWRSHDGIEISVSSALVSPRKARSFAKELVAEGPMLVWLPKYTDSNEGEEYVISEKSGYTPWIVCPSGGAILDEDDPLGMACSVRRPRLARKYASTSSLRTRDPFGRVWKNSRQRFQTRSEVWSCGTRRDGERPEFGVRLLCFKQFIATHTTQK
jgi:hypothetical protein